MPIRHNMHYKRNYCKQITVNILDSDLRRSNDNDNDNEIDLFRHHNGNNTSIKLIFKQMTMLDKCNCI